MEVFITHSVKKITYFAAEIKLNVVKNNFSSLLRNRALRQRYYFFSKMLNSYNIYQFESYLFSFI